MLATEMVVIGFEKRPEESPLFSMRFAMNIPGFKSIINLCENTHHSSGGEIL